jgi:hypothetical protein
MGIEKFELFKKMLSVMEDMADVTDATTSNYAGDMEITGWACGTEIRFLVHIENKEDNNND